MAVVAPLLMALVAVVIALPRSEGAEEACWMLERVSQEAVESFNAQGAGTGGAASTDFGAQVRLRLDYDLLAAAAPPALAEAVEVGRSYAEDLRVAIEAGSPLPEATTEVLAADQELLRWFEGGCT